MTKFKIGEWVQILDDEEVNEHLRKQTGIIGKSGGLGKLVDSVMVKLNKGGEIFIHERFLKKI